MSRIKLDVTFAHDSIKIDKAPSLKPVAEATADVVKRAIAAQPGHKWDRTGRLRGGIRAVRNNVEHPSDRLQHDALKQRFVDEVVPADPTTDSGVTRALEQIVDAMFSGK